MCANYGLDPRFGDVHFDDEPDAELVEALRTWADRNAGEVIRPTGRRLRNLNPIVVGRGGAPALEEAWWGLLVDGAPARFPSINTRSERVRQSPDGLAGRAIVPATSWYEMQKPSRVWNEFTLAGRAVFGMAAVTRLCHTDDGSWLTCYSILMRPAPPRLAGIHERMPVLLSPGLAREWLTARPSRALMDDVLLASEDVARWVEAATIAGRPDDRRRELSTAPA
ncbi:MULTISPECIES: SOS response-associated peptidase family protein [Bacteria]|uniref:SOS response-associated peptidase family protein n=1 Tax=Bacteria TaxID=2 RepID=UPI003C7A669B